VPNRRLGFDTARAIVLGTLGSILLAGLLTIIAAAVREATLAPGIEPDAIRRKRARRAVARALVVIAFVLTGGAFWWRSEDARFVNSMQRPIAARATVESGRLVLSIQDPAWQRARTPLIEDHGKIMHLFVIAADGQSVFAHLHPMTIDSARFSAPQPPVPAGRYRMYGDVVYASGLTETLVAAVDLPAPSGGADWSNDPDDSWALGRRNENEVRLQDGTRLDWLRNARLIAGAEAGLQFVIHPASGDTARLEPYMGMPGHAVVVRDDGQVFIHLHPLGTISVAAQMALSTDAIAHPKTTALSDTLYFPYAFPAPGHYTVWVQLKRGGQVLTGSFRAEVTASLAGER
jgi:hypothetical protein